jgi:hypothetical protein
MRCSEAVAGADDQVPICRATERGDHSPSSSQRGNVMISRNWFPSWKAFACPGREDVDGLGHIHIASSPTRGTVTREAALVAPTSPDPPHHPAATRSAVHRATRSGRPRAFLFGHLRPSQCGRALHQSPQIVAWPRHTLRETSRQLPSDRGPRLHRHLAGVVICQADPNMNDIQQLRGAVRTEQDLGRTR